MTINEPSLIGNRYAITGLIAQGMMGPVYRGLDQEMGRPVAIKALRPEVLAQHPTLLERFLREGDALRQLDYPNMAISHKDAKMYNSSFSPLVPFKTRACVAAAKTDLLLR